MPRFWVSREYIEELKTPGNLHRVRISEAIIDRIIEAIECTLSFQGRNEIFTVAMPLKEIEINPVFIEEYHGDEV